MTPFDWKLDGAVAVLEVVDLGHHSLVTPFDWKHDVTRVQSNPDGGSPHVGYSL